jgi:hypothetical protein
VPRSASVTEIQNGCGSRSWPCIGTHAMPRARPTASIHDFSKTVFPLPGGADILVTRAVPPSRPNSVWRGTISPRIEGATGALAAWDRVAGLGLMSVTVDQHIQFVLWMIM